MGSSWTRRDVLKALGLAGSAAAAAPLLGACGVGGGGGQAAQNGANEVSAPAEVAAITAMAVKGARIRSGTLAAGGPALLDGELAGRLFGREDEQARRRGLAGATGRP